MKIKKDETKLRKELFLLISFFFYEKEEENYLLSSNANNHHRLVPLEFSLKAVKDEKPPRCELIETSFLKDYIICRCF